MPSEDDDRPRKKISHEIGQDLSLLSVEELTERIALLNAEIERLQQAAARSARQRMRRTPSSSRDLVAPARAEHSRGPIAEAALVAQRRNGFLQLIRCSGYGPRLRRGDATRPMADMANKA